MKGAESAEGLLALPKGWPDTTIATTTTTTLLHYPNDDDYYYHLQSWLHDRGLIGAAVLFLLIQISGSGLAAFSGF